MGDGESGEWESTCSEFWVAVLSAEWRTQDSGLIADD